MQTKGLLTMMMAGAVLLSSCGTNKTSSSGLTLSGLDRTKFEKEIDGIHCDLYTLKNDNGVEACITNYGGRLVSLMVPDRDGKMTDVVLGFDNVDDYINIPSDFGASIGRYANRIAGASFEIDGQTFSLPVNDRPDKCLHGGPRGWQYQMYSAEQTSPTTLSLTRVSPDGDMQFPGTVVAKVTYTLTQDNAIDISYAVTTDSPTVVNMTNHSYFNLSGDPESTGMDQVMWLDADSFTPTDKGLIPTGEIRPVEGTVMDFRTPKALEGDIDKDYEPLVFAGGYDHNWCINNPGDITRAIASLTSPRTGIKMQVYTDQPGIQVYAGNFLTGKIAGKGGKVYPRRASICLETQFFPDAIHHPEWGQDPILRPGGTYTHRCIYKFTVE